MRVSMRARQCGPTLKQTLSAADCFLMTLDGVAIVLASSFCKHASMEQ